MLAAVFRYTTQLGVPARFQGFFVAQSQFRQSGIVASHPNIGTTAQAIAAGIPQVIRPMAHDQPDTAARVEKLGIGVSLSPQKFDAASLAAKLDVLVTSQSVLERCKIYAGRIHPDQSLNETCMIIENFSRDQM